MSTEIKANCPECGYAVDAAAPTHGDATVRPGEGDLAICIRCAGMGIYYLAEDGTLALRLTTIKEKVELSQDEHVRQVREKVADMMAGWH
jgi:hypothetical protein